MAKISILGAGTWGTALANCLTNIGHSVKVWTKFQNECENITKNHEHPNLPGVQINPNIVFSTNLGDIINDPSAVIFATPSVFIRDTALAAKPFLKEEQIIVTVAKGIENNTFFTMTEILEDVLGNGFKVVALSGPTHAEEVSKGIPSTIVSAGKDQKATEFVQKLFEGTPLRVYTNNDVLGVEICGALKNIIALATGISDGLGFGDNTRAAIITRGLAEITRLGKAMGCNIETFIGLAGVGDLVVTATSRHSRNSRAGNLLGQGHSLEDTLKEVGMVVEGINALEAAKSLAKKYEVDTPIIDAVYAIVRNGKKPKEIVLSLLSREQKQEN